MDSQTLSPTLEVFRTLHRLKELPRQGYVYFGFKRDETDAVAEHSFMVSWIAYTLAKHLELPEEEVAKVVLMGLIHDWGEAVTGDLSYRVKSQELVRTEKRAFECLVNRLQSRETLEEIWGEYDEHCSRASAIVKCADALDAWIQGLVTPSTWWPAWEDYNQRTFDRLAKTDGQLAEQFRRMSAIAKDPNVQIWLPEAKANDAELWPLVRFFKGIYSLKELPRHGFVIFGMKRSETDTFAGHGFATASLALLISLELLGERQLVELKNVVMTALSHDLGVALTGDAAYDLQGCVREVWDTMAKEAVRQLVQGLRCSEEVGHLHGCWIEPTTRNAWIVKVAAAVDAWEMGVTTPSAWMHAWLDYSKKASEALAGAKIDEQETLSKILAQAYSDLSTFDEVRGGRAPKIIPIRLQ